MYTNLLDDHLLDDIALNYYGTNFVEKKLLFFLDGLYIILADIFCEKWLSWLMS